MMLNVLYALETLYSNHKINYEQFQNAEKLYAIVQTINKQNAINDVARCNKSLRPILYSASFQNMLNQYGDAMLISIAYAESTYTNLKESAVGDIGFFQVNSYVWNTETVRKELCYYVPSKYTYYNPSKEAEVSLRILVYNIANYIKHYGYGHALLNYTLTYNSIYGSHPYAYVRNISNVLYISLSAKNSNTVANYDINLYTKYTLFDYSILPVFKLQNRNICEIG